MAARIKIALMYHYDENWIGGTYYIQNLISACNLLPEHSKPEFVLVSADNKGNLADLKRITAYPYLSDCDTFSRLLLSKVKNELSHIFLKKPYYDQKYRYADVVFPAGYEDKMFHHQQYLCWIPDFQEHYLPEFFTAEELQKRKSFQLDMLNKAKYIVFSSRSANRDFKDIYKNSTVQQFVMPFAVTHPALPDDLQQLLVKFNLPGKYFICSNQFWKHKNHKVILRAIHALKQKGIHITVAFTGKEHDFRNPEYYDELKSLVAEYDIADNVRFLGFIGRGEQLVLMKNAAAIIQPSLFEGWSTVIEDGKALNQEIVASSIDVHQEQLEQYPSKSFFKPDSEQDLAGALLKIWSSDKAGAPLNGYDYKKDMMQFANSFIDIIGLITKKK